MKFLVSLQAVKISSVFLRYKYMKSIDRFIENFADLFDETDSDTINANTHFKELDEWSSLIALSVIAMIDEEYDVEFRGDDIRNSVTVNDLFDAVMSKVE